MELPRRAPDDVYLPDGSLKHIIERLRLASNAHDLRVGIFYPFDFRTRMLPYWYADKRVAPCSVRTLADSLDAAGFKHIRIVLQQWTPRLDVSQAVLDGEPLDLLLVSAMQVHAERAYDYIRQAHRMGSRRPLIIAGGPKAIYEPTDFFNLEEVPGLGADCVVTGEVFVLLELLDVMLGGFRPEEGLRVAFERARNAGSLRAIPGLVFLDPENDRVHPTAISTGVQRLVRDLDELPLPDAGYRVIEPPHRRRTMSAAPVPADRIGKHSIISTLLSTQGCKFNCSYCPIPGVNQRTWRHKSPDRFAAEIKHIHEAFGIREFFGTDDNFFNHRQTVVDLMTALARTGTSGVPLGERINFYTEATEFDVHKNRDLLPLCRKAGLRAIWFGIEDITGKLVNKGQSADKTQELFAILKGLGIQSMALTIHSDDQPLRSPRANLSGLLNQADYLFDMGAVSYQCTYLGPAVGTRDFEPAARRRIMFKAVGGRPVPQAYQDGNHVAASGHAKPWQRQINLLRAYARFYNPANTARILMSMYRDPLAGKRLLFQVIGQIGLLMTIPKLLGWAWRLRRGPISAWDGLQPARIPLADASSGEQVHWAVQRVASADLPPPGMVRRPTIPLSMPRAKVESGPEGVTDNSAGVILRHP